MIIASTVLAGLLLAGFGVMFCFRRSIRLRPSSTRPAEGVPHAVTAAAEPQSPPAPREFTAEEHLALAEAARAGGRRDEAFDHYSAGKRLGAVVPAEALGLMAECHAARRDTSNDAMEAYLRAIMDPALAGERVCALLQSICQVSEDMDSPKRRTAAEWNRRVIAANPSFEWAHYFLGLACLLDGPAAEAAGHFASARELNPRRALTWYWLGICQLQSDNPDLQSADETIKHLLSFPSLSPKNRKREAWLAGEMGRRLIGLLGGFEGAAECATGQRQETLDRAAAYFQAAAERMPDDGVCHFQLGRIRQLQNDFPSALAAFERASQCAPGDKRFLFFKAREYERVGRCAEATAALQEAIHVDPGYIDARVLLGRLLFAAGDWAGCESVLQPVLPARPSDRASLALTIRSRFALNKFEAVVETAAPVPAGTFSAPNDREVMLAIALAFARLGRPEDAAGWFSAAGDENETAYYSGMAHVTRGDTAAALECLEAVSASTGNSHAADAMLTVGQLHAGSGAAEAARRAFERLLEMVSGHPGAHYGLGILDFNDGDFASAATHFSLAAPGSSQARFAVGVAEERLGNSDAALAAYRAVGSGRFAADAHLRSGILLCRARRFAEALPCLDTHGLLAPPQEDARCFYRGLALASTGSYDEALGVWGELRGKRPGCPDASGHMARVHYLLGAGHAGAGRLGEAVQEWETYLRSFPDDQQTTKRLADACLSLASASLRRSAGPGISAAVAWLRRALNHDPGHTGCCLQLALCEMRQGQFATAATRLRKLALKENAPAAFAYHFAICQLHEGQSEDACRILRDVTASCASGVYAPLAGQALANEHLRAGRTTEGLELLMQAAPEAAMAAPGGSE